MDDNIGFADGFADGYKLGKEYYKPKWIPVTERLPENKQEVLVTEYGETDIGRRFEGRWVDRYGDKMKDVTAWMPLPGPYQEEGENQ